MDPRAYVKETFPDIRDVRIPNAVDVRDTADRVFSWIVAILIVGTSIAVMVMVVPQSHAVLRQLEITKILQGR